uniref:Uncharacterized protein n=1 Tax=Sipha flava TaxID=143950 RepID=A0A2S2Q550_9HEMI
MMIMVMIKNKRNTNPIRRVGLVRGRRNERVYIYIYICVCVCVCVYVVLIIHTHMLAAFARVFFFIIYIIVFLLRLAAVADPSTKFLDPSGVPIHLYILRGGAARYFYEQKSFLVPLLTYPSP